MEGAIIARVLHVLGVVLWIGGVAFVTVVLLPEVKRLREPAERIEFFEKMEAGFARHARVTTLVTGLSGIYLVHSLGAWERFAELQYWWMHAMVLVWGVFTLMLFVLEPLWLHRWFRERAQRDPDGTLATITRLHWLLLLASLTTVAGAAAGSHDWSFGR
jgi:uncharacterized membrane protein